MTSSFGCPHCGKSNPVETLFSAFCGTNLQDVDTDSLARPDPNPTDEPLPAHPPRPARRPQPHRPLPSGNEQADRSRLRRPSLHSQSDPPPSQEPRPLDPSPPDFTPTRADREAPILLDPLSIDAYFPLDSPSTRPSGLGEWPNDEARRQWRQIFAAEVPLLGDPAPSEPIHGAGLQRRRWLEWLLMAMLLVLVGGRWQPGETLPHVWPGLDAVYAAVDALPVGAIVLVNWAYDPATAGEMDLVAAPVIAHLFTRQTQLVIVSQLPLGPATARRLIAQVQPSTADRLRAVDSMPVEAGFLPGGISTLPLLGQAPLVGMPADVQGRRAGSLSALATLDDAPPALAVVIAASPNAVQHWLEQVQPLNRVPTVALTSAAADPVLRPYVDSGQLLGIVSGYSGGNGYRLLRNQPPTHAEQIQIWQQISGHNGALLVLVVAVIVGHLSLWNKRRRS